MIVLACFAVVLSLLTVLELLRRRRRARDHRIVESFGREVNAKFDEQGDLVWFGSGFQCRFERSTRQRPAQVLISVQAGLPATEFLARGANGLDSAFSTRGLRRVTTEQQVAYSAFSSDPSYVTHLLDQGLAQGLTPGQGVSLRLDPAGLVIARKAFSEESSSWTVHTFRSAYASAVQLASLANARPV